MGEAAVVEVSLKWFLDLWETHNNDVHGHTKTEQTTRLQTWHQITAHQMMTQKPLVRPSDYGCSLLTLIHSLRWPQRILGLSRGSHPAKKTLSIAQRWLKRNLPRALPTSQHSSNPLIRAARPGWDHGAKTNWFTIHTTARRQDRKSNAPVGAPNKHLPGASHCVNN